MWCKFNLSKIVYVLQVAYDISCVIDYADVEEIPREGTVVKGELCSLEENTLEVVRVYRRINQISSSTE